MFEVRDGVCLSVHIYECTCTAAINNREQYCCKADIPIFIQTFCYEYDMYPFQYLDVMLKSRINKISAIIKYCRGHISQWTDFPAVHH